MEGPTPTTLDMQPAAAATAVPMSQPQEAAPISAPPQPPASGQKDRSQQVGGEGPNDALSAMKPNQEENGVKQAGEASAIGEGDDEGGEEDAFGGSFEEQTAGNKEMAGKGQAENAAAEETGAATGVPAPPGAPMDVDNETSGHGVEGANEYKDGGLEKNGLRDEGEGGAAGIGAEGGFVRTSGSIEDDELDAASAGRLRKIVERFGNRVQTNDVKKTLQVPKGKGTALEDMPNVASKLSRLTRNSPIVGHLHNLIFGGKAKKSELKPQLLGFSGIPDDDALEKVTSRLDGRRWPVALMKEAMDLLEIPRGASSFKEGKNPDRGMLTARLLEWLQKPVPSGLEPPGPKKRKSMGKGKTATSTPAKKKAKTAETPAKSKATPKGTKKASSGASSKKASPTISAKKASLITTGKKASSSTTGKKASPSGTKKSVASAKKPSSSAKKTATGGKKSPASPKKGSTAASSKKVSSTVASSKKGSPKKASPASAKKTTAGKKSPAKPAKKTPAGKGSAVSGKKTPSKVASKKAPAKSSKKSPLVTKKGKAGGVAAGAAKPKTVKRKKGESSSSASMLSKQRKAGGDAAGGKSSPKRAKPAKAKAASKKRKAQEVEEQKEPEEYVEYRDMEDGQEDGEGMEEGPSADDLRAKVEEIIADSEDVPNLTFKMMKSQLEEHFDVPLADRKNELIDILSEAMP